MPTDSVLRRAGAVSAFLALGLPLTLAMEAGMDGVADAPFSVGPDPGFWRDHAGAAVHGVLLGAMVLGAAGCLLVALLARRRPSGGSGRTALIWTAPALAVGTALYLAVLGPGIRPRRAYDLELELTALAQGAAKARLGELASRKAELGRWDLHVSAVAQSMGNRRYRLMPSQAVEDLTLDALITLGDTPWTFRLDLAARGPKGQAIVYACDQDGTPLMNDPSGFKALLPSHFRRSLVLRWWKVRYWGR